MYSFLTVVSTLVGCFAICWSISPSFRHYVTLSTFAGPAGPDVGLFLHEQNYSTIAISTDPLVIYISNFLSESEISHVLNVTDELFVPSRAYSPDTPSHRNSSSCILPSSDPAHSVIASRSKAFLDEVIEKHPSAGLSYFDLEALQLVKYGPNEYYRAHVDWFDRLHREKKGWNPRLYNRGASFFIYLDDQCEGGETQFPEIMATTTASQSASLSRYTVNSEKGVSFQPKRGNGIFWVNLKPNGLGDKRLIHAALPLERGRKVGMNIWVKRDFGW